MGNSQRPIIEVNLDTTLQDSFLIPVEEYVLVNKVIFWSSNLSTSLPYKKEKYMYFSLNTLKDKKYFMQYVISFDKRLNKKWEYPEEALCVEGRMKIYSSKKEQTLSLHATNIDYNNNASL